MNKDFTFTQSGVYYTCNTDNIAKYIQKKGDTIGIYQSGIEPPFIIIDKDNKKAIVNNNITDFGVGAEATQIKLCAVLNTAIEVFKKANFEIESQDLGEIAPKKSVYLDRQKKKAVIDLSDLF